MGNKKKGKVVNMLSPENYIKQKARSLPVHECRISADWEESGFPLIVVARKHTTGSFTVGLFLVDLKCLGVKDAQYFFNIYANEYRDLCAKYEGISLETVPYPLVHNIIYAGFEFAEDYGFKPHKDFTVAEFILEEDTDDIDFIDIPCGHNGKPLYVRGPHDSDYFVAETINRLEKTAGAGDYEVILNPGEEDFEED